LNGICLTSDAAAFHHNGNIEGSAVLSGSRDRRQDGFKITNTGEVSLGFFLVDDKAARTTHHPNASGRLFATTNTFKVLNRHNSYAP
jgi:hypothetical protein